MAIVINILLAIHVLVSLLIILLVLMQRPKSEGLGAAFGGGMTDNLFGAQGTNVLQTITRWLGCIFFGLSLTLSIFYVKKEQSKADRSLQQRLLSAPVPATPAPGAPGASDPEMQKVMEQLQKEIEKQKGAPAPTDATPAPVEGATAPVPVPAPSGESAPAPAPVPAPAPAAPEKAPEPAK